MHGALEGKEVSVSDGITFLNKVACKRKPIESYLCHRRLMRARVNGERVSFVINEILTLQMCVTWVVGFVALQSERG